MNEVRTRDRHVWYALDADHYLCRTRITVEVTQILRNKFLNAADDRRQLTEQHGMRMLQECIDERMASVSVDKLIDLLHKARHCLTYPDARGRIDETVENIDSIMEALV